MSVFDDASAGIFLRELAVIYESFAAGKPAPPLDVPTSSESGQWLRVVVKPKPPYP